MHDRLACLQQIHRYDLRRRLCYPYGRPELQNLLHEDGEAVSGDVRDPYGELAERRGEGAIQKLDMAVSIPTWIGAYEQELARQTK